MTEAENQTLNLLKNLIENRQEIYERLAPRINIVNILGYKEREGSNSKLLYYLFNTHFKYYDKEINFVKDLSLYIVGNEYKDKIKDAKFENVYREFQTKEGRRIDILIVFDKFEIIIENKIWAGDQPNQLKDYYIDRNNGKLVFLVYLTRGGYEASEYSIEKEIKEELKNKIYYLSHDDMAKWIENDILNKYKFLKFDEKYQSIYSALIQIRDNEKIITNPNEENNMEKEEIKKFFEENKYFETLLKDKSSMDDKFDTLENFKQLLENSKNIVLDKRVELVSDDINYSLKLFKCLEDIRSTKSEDYMKGAIFYRREQIENDFKTMKWSGKWSGSMNIPIFNGLSIELEQQINYHLCVSVYSKNNDITNKLKEETIKTEIGKILDKDKDSDKCGEYSEYEDWDCIYSLYIDTEKDPKYIADKIIELYEFLRDNIKLDNA